MKTIWLEPGRSNTNTQFDQGASCYEGFGENINEVAAAALYLEFGPVRAVWFGKRSVVVWTPSERMNEARRNGAAESD
jgi:hypothetical protein